MVSFTFIGYLKFNFKNEASLSINFNNLHNGDLILRCGRSAESFAIYLADANTDFTHIGIISIENDILYVIHAVPSKTNLVQKERLTNFLNSKNTSKFAIYRSNFNEVYLDKVVKTANSYYLNKYEFDNEYDLNTNAKLYCTELILKAFKNAGILLNIKPKEFNYVIGKHPIIFPSEFTKQPIFNKII